MPACPTSSTVAGHAEWMWVPRLGFRARSSSRSLLGRIGSVSLACRLGGCRLGGCGVGGEQAARHGEAQDLGGALGDAPGADQTVESRKRMPFDAGRAA